MACDYEAVNEFHLDPGAAGKGWVAGGCRVRVSPGGIEGVTTKRYCSRAHLELAEHGVLSTRGGSVEEIVRHPELADGQEAPG
jgi:hypothetical protein